MRWGRLLVTGILTAYSLYVILGTEGKKETALEAKIRQVKGQIEETASTDPKLADLKTELAQLESNLLDLDSAKGKQKELKAKLQSLSPESTEYQETARTLASIERQIPKWYDRFPLNLGLDLRGGTEVRLRIINERQQRVVVAIQEERDNLTPGTDAYKKANRELQDAKDLLNTNINNAVEVIRKRLNRQGLASIPVSKEGANRIRVQLPGMDSERAKGIIDSIKTAGQLEFRIVTDYKANPNDYKRFQSFNLPPNTLDVSKNLGRKLKSDEIDKNGLSKIGAERLYDWLEIAPEVDKDGAVKKSAELLLVKQNPKALTGKHIKRATYTFSQTDRNYEVLIDFDREGSFQFGRLTSENVGRRLGIIIDNRLVSAPTIQDAIHGTCRITGNFSKTEAEQLAVILQDGSLPVDLQVEMENTVGPTLGEDSIRRGMEAIVFGLVLVLVFMLIYYLVAGLITNAGLVFNMLFILSILIGANATLTLPGIAGLILTVGMAVDANVLIFERIREELKKGSTLISAIDNGYDRAFVTIVDANITTLITALILNEFGTETVKGFAITLMIGIITSMFVSLFITRGLFHLLLDAKLIKNLKMSKIVGTPKIDFVSLCKPAVCISVLVIIVGMVTFAFRGDRNYSNDLTSGTLAHFNLKEKLPIAEARKKLEVLREQGFNDVSLQSFGTDEREYVIRTKLVNPEGKIEGDDGEKATRTGDSF
ncbi:MAG: protein translocase subunit SecD, partial [Planctomycetota bacterium]